jgi:hypothetical protein
MNCSRSKSFKVDSVIRQAIIGEDEEPVENLFIIPSNSNRREVIKGPTRKDIVLYFILAIQEYIYSARLKYSEIAK